MQKIRENLNFQTHFGIGFVLVLGTLSHFFYEWSGENRLVGILLAVLLLCYLLFTAFPPHIGLFLDPVTGTYGFPV